MASPLAVRVNVNSGFEDSAAGKCTLALVTVYSVTPVAELKISSRVRWSGGVVATAEAFEKVGILSGCITESAKEGWRG